jgi:hypothetical protein
MGLKEKNLRFSKNEAALPIFLFNSLLTKNAKFRARPSLLCPSRFRDGINKAEKQICSNWRGVIPPKILHFGPEEIDAHLREECATKS